MFGFMEYDGVESNDIKLVYIVWIFKNWMKWYGIRWNSFHPLPSFPLIFHSIQFKRYTME
jgi:hypothetical protein